ncbi:MAG: hypothetical protein JNL85_07045 [Rubrivivax sp.]|nr:hypothetical protein [Rubrivivax sp.]
MRALWASAARRALRWAAAAAALGLASGCETIVEAVQGKPMHEIAVGQAAVGSLNRRVDSQLRVRSTTTPGRSYRTCWSESSGRGSGTVTTRQVCSSGQEMNLRNEYSRSETVSGTTSLWRIDTAALAQPTRVLLLVRGRGFRPLASLFVDVADNALESSPSIALPANGERDDEVAGLVDLAPGRRYFIAVQSAQALEADFVVAVRVVTREQR